MRSKEESDDYRYFPDPDLVPILVDQAWIDRVAGQVPELPSAKRERFAADYGFEDSIIEVLTADPETADYFEQVVSEGADSRKAANWIQGDVLRIVNETKVPVAQLKVTPEHLSSLIKLIDADTISGNIAKKVFQEMTESGDAPDVVVERLGLVQISDEGELEAVVDQILADHPGEVEGYKSGNKKLMGFFMGQVMKATKGQANPKLATQLVAKRLG